MWLELSEQGRRGQGRWHRILEVTGRTWAFTPMSREPWRAVGGRGTDLTQAHRRPLAAAGDRPVGDLSRSWGGVPGGSGAGDRGGWARGPPRVIKWE